MNISHARERQLWRPEMENPYLFLTDVDFVRLMALQPDAPLRAELERAIVVAPDAMPPGVVGVGSEVRYRDEHAGVSRRIRIVYPEDADAGQGKVSVLAPVGAALIGLEVGQTIDWKFPSGEVRRLRVEDVPGPHDTPAARHERISSDSGASD